MNAKSFSCPARRAGRQSLRSFLVALVVMCAAVGCDKPQKQKEQFKFAELPISYSAVTHLADALGYCKQEDLNYFTQSVPAGPDVVAALRNTGSSGANAGGIAVTPVITMIAAGDQPVVLATTIISDQQVRLVTFANTGITSDPTTLRGKRIGVVRNTNGDIYLSRLLKKGGLTEKDVVLVNGRPSDLRNLLLDGSLDAAALWDPFVAQAVRMYGQNVAKDASRNRGEPLLLVDKGLHTLAFNIVTTKAQLQNRRADLVRLLKAAVAGGQFIDRDKKQSQAMLEKWLDLQSGDLDFFMTTTQFGVQLDVPQMKEWMKGELEWLKTSQPDAKVPSDLSSYIDGSLLKEVNAALVKE